MQASTPYSMDSPFNELLIISGVVSVGSSILFEVIVVCGGRCVGGVLLACQMDV